ncbi:MAG: TetR/AcrR family transcriptional regulator, partial [Calditrichaeota bacterium]|nr:TetR/AcrR family transcriptional regulator [Calditrichota bacterium]
LSPFSEESRPLREKNILLFKEALEGAAEKVPASLLGKLPELLWLFKMLIIIFWLYDASTQQQRTYRLIDKSTDLVVKLIAISNLPVVRSFTEQLANLILEFKPYS